MLLLFSRGDASFFNDFHTFCFSHSWLCIIFYGLFIVHSEIEFSHHIDFMSRDTIKLCDILKPPVKPMPPSARCQSLDFTKLFNMCISHNGPDADGVFECHDGHYFLSIKCSLWKSGGGDDDDDGYGTVNGWTPDPLIDSCVCMCGFAVRSKAIKMNHSSSAITKNH